MFSNILPFTKYLIELKIVTKIVFWPTAAYSSNLVGQMYCTFPMGWSIIMFLTWINDQFSVPMIKYWDYLNTGDIYVRYLSVHSIRVFVLTRVIFTLLRVYICSIMLVVHNYYWCCFCFITSATQDDKQLSETRTIRWCTRSLYWSKK